MLSSSFIGFFNQTGPYTDDFCLTVNTSFDTLPDILWQFQLESNLKANGDFYNENSICNPHS